jgi:hypothetical protein
VQLALDDVAGARAVLLQADEILEAMIQPSPHWHIT